MPPDPLSAQSPAEARSRVAGDQVPGVDPQVDRPAGDEDGARLGSSAIQLPGKLEALEAVAGASRGFLETKALPVSDDEQLEHLSALLTLCAAVQVLDAVEEASIGRKRFTQLEELLEGDVDAAVARIAEQMMKSGALPSRPT